MKALLERLHELSYSEGKSMISSSTAPPKDVQKDCRSWPLISFEPGRTC